MLVKGRGKVEPRHISPYGVGMVVHAGEYDKPVRKRAKGKEEGREENSIPPLKDDAS